MDGVSLVRAYYRSIDADEYTALADVLSEEFVHRRPDTTIQGRDEFVAFMRRGRPDQSTEHVIETIYREHNGDRIAAEGRLLGADGSDWFGFVDSFEIENGKIRSVRTYTDVSPD
ncbi:MAG: nuclear transport factor 2 family protein [Natronomonas sp.]